MTSRRILPLLVLVLCAFAVNANTLSNGFVWDDYFQIVNNQRISHVRFLPDIFSKDVFDAENGQPCNYYRPLMYVIYMLTFFVFSGLKTWGFHLVNILLHAAVTALVFLLVSRLIPDDEPDASPFFKAPFLAALLFALHPIHTEAVAWAACVPELAFTLFSLLSLRSYARSAHSFDRDHLASCLFFALGILSKETAVTVLPLLLTYDLVFRRQETTLRQCAVRFAPFVFTLGIYAALRIRAIGAVAPVTRHQDLSSFEVVINIPVLFMQYLGKLLMPINLNAYYDFRGVRSVTDPKWLLAIAVLIGFAALAVMALRKSKPAFFGLMVILVPLLPAFYIRGLGDFIFAERYLYFPSFGFSLVVGTLLSAALSRRSIGRIPVMAVVLALACSYALATVYRNAVWHDDLRLWADTITKSPDSPIPQQHVGVSYYNAGDLASAEKYLAAASLKGNASTKSLTALAGIYLLTSREEQSLALLSRVLQRTPDNPEILLMLGNAYRGMGNEGMAQIYYGKVSTMFPGFDQVLLQRVMDLCREGERLMAGNQLQEAEVRFREAYLMKSDFVPTLIDLGSLYATKGDAAKAIHYLSKAASLDRNNPAPHYNLSVLYEMIGKPSEAKEEMALFNKLDAAAKSTGNPAGPVH